MNSKRVRETLGMLRDEVKLHLHLASLDVKKTWDTKLEPRINDVRAFVTRLRGSPGAPSKA
jgi:hypothetical protein